MKNIYLLLFFFSIFSFLFAQTQEDSLEVNNEEVIISANKVPEKRENVAQEVRVITAAELQRNNSQTTADVVAATGQVMVQKSQQGGGSPIIRGFEASRVLLMIDGVRMNNLIYRAGHLQNVITIDNSILERAEVLFGPSSTIYGSDALGGVLHFYTKNPQFAQGDKNFLFKGNANLRYSSANQEKTGHINFNFANKRWASLTAFSYSDFGDLRAGGVYNKDYPDFGKRKYYVERINGIDSLMANSNPNIQVGTAYNQWSLLEKIAFKQNSHSTHQLNIQLSNSSNIPRYDRLTDPSSGGTGLRFAEWYYGPQKRNMVAYDFNHKVVSDEGVLKTFHIGVNYQDIEESRYTRRYRNNGLQARIEKVNVIGFNVDRDMRAGKHDLRYGIDAQYNLLKSTANQTDIVTQAVTPLSTRYPDGNNRMTNSAAYITHTYELSDKITFNEGFRLGYISLNSTFIDTTFFPFPFKSVKQSHLVPNGNIGIIYKPIKDFRIAYIGSTGFRAPNVDDLGKVFDSSPGYLIVPNPNVKPEKTFNNELSINYNAANKVIISLTAYYTYFYNAIITDKFTFEGKDSILYDGIMSAILANQNQQKARIYGANANITFNFTENLTFATTLTYTRGRIVKDTGLLPLDHIPPIFGKTSVWYHTNKWDAEVWANYSGAKKIADYLLNGEDNEQYATADGMPAWWTLNLRGSYKVNKYVNLQAGCENILDKHYRVFASGMSAAGRNIYLAVRTSF